MLLVDTRGHDDVARLVADLQAPDGSSVLIAFAPAEACAEVARAVRGSAAFAVLPIPPEPGQTAAVIEGASEEARARCALLAGADPVATPAADPLPEPATPTVVAPATRARGPTPLVRTRRAGPRPRWPVFAAAAFALLVAAAGWVWLNGDGVPDAT